MVFCTLINGSLQRKIIDFGCNKYYRVGQQVLSRWSTSTIVLGNKYYRVE